MSVSVERHEGIKAAVVRLSGDVDLAVVPVIEGEIAGLLSSGLCNLVLDLSEVKYADSSALGLLVWLDRELDGTDGKVVLVGADRNVTRILEMSGLISVAESIRTGDSVEDALGGLEVVPSDAEPLWVEEFSIMAEVGALAQARDRVYALLEPLHFSTAALFDIKVALGEALANAVRHGSPEDTGASIQVSVSALDDRVAIAITDAGGGFDGRHDVSDDLYASGGRGIMFMRALMDHVAFSPSENGGTVVTLVKHRSVPQDASA
jgi:anti-anti-sigma factor